LGKHFDLLDFLSNLSCSWYYGSNNWGISVGFGFIPSIISLVLTFVFYWKSVQILKGHSTFELKSTSDYIKNLRAYSFSQILTMGPTIFFYFLHGFTTTSDFVQNTYVQAFVHSTAAFAGLINVLIFIRQGSQSYNKPVVEIDFDLSKDLI